MADPQLEVTLLGPCLDEAGTLPLQACIRKALLGLQRVRGVIPAVPPIALGIRILCSSFFLGLPGMPRK